MSSHTEFRFQITSDKDFLFETKGYSSLSVQSLLDSVFEKYAKYYKKNVKIIKKSPKEEEEEKKKEETVVAENAHQQTEEDSDSESMPPLEDEVEEKNEEEIEEEKPIPLPEVKPIVLSPRPISTINTSLPPLLSKPVLERQQCVTPPVRAPMIPVPIAPVDGVLPIIPLDEKKETPIAPQINNTMNGWFMEMIGGSQKFVELVTGNSDKNITHFMRLNATPSLARAQAVKAVWDNYGMCEFISTSNPNKTYRVVFPPAGEVLNKDWGNHAYPACSCPSFKYNSKGLVYCKHIDELLKKLNLSAMDVNWKLMPENYLDRVMSQAEL